MIFNNAFNLFILNQTVTGWGFQQPTGIRLPNGFLAYPCGYFTEYQNGYKLIISGASLGLTPIQEVMILDPEGVPVARDTEDIRTASED